MKQTTFGRVALVHDWLVGQRGGENVLLELCRMFPQAPIYTLVHRPQSVHPEIERHRIHTSCLQRLPAAHRRFRAFLPLFPWALSRLDLGAYDLLISTSHCVAKAVKAAPGARHVSYVHTPMRYLYEQMPAYLPQGGLGAILHPVARGLSWPLRRWDVATAGRPDVLVANSAFVAQRIATAWGRPAEVVHPPVDVDFFAQAPRRARRGWLVVSALVPYKRVDLAVRFATARGLDLQVIGQGPEEARLRRMAGPTVHFVGSLSREDLREAYAQACGLMFCGVEDCGIVPIEAMACGCPVLAYNAGGVAETVRDVGGVLFEAQTMQSMGEGYETFVRLASRGRFGRQALLSHAQCFSRQAFLTAMAGIVERFNYQPNAHPSASKADGTEGRHVA